MSLNCACSRCIAGIGHPEELYGITNWHIYTDSARDSEAPKVPTRVECDPNYHNFRRTLNSDERPILFCRRCGSTRPL